MYSVSKFWYREPDGVKLLVLTLCAIALLSAYRFARLSRRLYGYLGKRIGPESLLEGDAAPSLLAAGALANRVAWDEGWARRLTSLSRKEAEGKKVMYVLGAADAKFLYLWEQCYADTVSARRACLVTVLLSALMLSYGAVPPTIAFLTIAILRAPIACSSPLTSCYGHSRSEFPYRWCFSWLRVCLNTH